MWCDFFLLDKEDGSWGKEPPAEREGRPPRETQGVQVGS
jgi:hypothetical protein